MCALSVEERKEICRVRNLTDKTQRTVGTDSAQPAQAAVLAKSSVGESSDIQLVEVSKRFGDIWALRPTNLSIYRGEFFALLGSSGSGKTTTLRLIAGFEEPTTGTVYLQGNDVSLAAPYERNVNTVFQDYALFPHMSVEQNVGYGLRVRRVPKAEIRSRVKEALRMVRLSGFEHRRPSQLSGGQRQRVALARALINTPAVLLLDEPLGALDLKLRREMQEELKRIQRDVGITFIYVTHDQEEAMSMSDRVAVMSDGSIQQIGTPTDVYEHPASAFVAGFVGVSNFLEGTVRGRDGHNFVVDVPGCERLLVSGGHDLSLGSTVLAAVRPEKITMSQGLADGNVAGGCMRGAIVDVSYAGAFTRYGVRVAEQEISVIEQNDGAGPRARLGEEVWLSWRIEQTTILPGSRGDAEYGQRAAGSGHRIGASTAIPS
jgi:spermidine/putrescine ABC transporter ATP-binding subunit